MSTCKGVLRDVCGLWQLISINIVSQPNQSISHLIFMCQSSRKILNPVVQLTIQIVPGPVIRVRHHTRVHVLLQQCMGIH